MAGKAHDTKNDFERCAALRDWKLTHTGGLPSRSSDQAAEKSLANWLSKTLRRRQRELGSAPTKRQLTGDQAAHLDNIIGMATGEMPAQVPTASHASTAATFQVNAGTHPARPVEHDPGHCWQGELAPEAPSERLRTEAPLFASKAVTICRRGLNIQWPL